MAVARVPGTAALQPGQILTDSVELVRVDLDSMSVAAFGRAPGPLWLWTGRSQVPLPFTVNASFDVVGDAVHLVSGPAFRVRVLERGRLRAEYGVRREPRAVAASDIDAYRAFVEAYVPESMRPDYRTALHPMVIDADDLGRCMEGPHGRRVRPCIRLHALMTGAPAEPEAARVVFGGFGHI